MRNTTKQIDTYSSQIDSEQSAAKELLEKVNSQEAVIDSLMKQQKDEELRKVFTGESDKFIVIIGPCSADNEDSVVDYVHRLVKVSGKDKGPPDYCTQSLHQ